MVRLILHVEELLAVPFCSDSLFNLCPLIRVVVRRNLRIVSAVLARN